jgi:alpha-D-ribose 1-methylphosphonate 5-triphosphate diphosphatase PhnM
MGHGHEIQHGVAVAAVVVANRAAETARAHTDRVGPGAANVERGPAHKLQTAQVPAVSARDVACPR